MPKNNLKIVNRKVADLIPAGYNPRKIGSREKLELSKSIKKFDFVEPIVVNMNKKRINIVVGGHQRLAIAKSLGYLEVPCVEVDLNERDEKELNLRLNKNKGEFDASLLAGLDKELLAEVGFLEKEMAKMFDDEIIDKEEEFTSEVLEENNYIVFVFNNSIDWLTAEDKLGLKSVQALDSKTDYKRKGTGRVLSGDKFLKLIK